MCLGVNCVDVDCVAEVRTACLAFQSIVTKLLTPKDNPFHHLFKLANALPNKTQKLGEFSLDLGVFSLDLEAFLEISDP